MLNSRLRRLILMMCALVFATGGSAQTMYLDTLSFYPDSNIIHTGLPVRWSGRVLWSGSLNVSYSLVYTFGNGQGYTISRSTALVPQSSDTFSAVHTYTSSGNYTAKVVLRNALGAAIDSLVRPFSVGSGFVVSGKVYYDCTQNCLWDTGELGPGNSWVGLLTNGPQRLYRTDSNGSYNIPLAAGDTLFGLGTIPYNINTTLLRGCAKIPITATNRSADLAIWLIDQVYIENLRVNNYACMADLFELAVDMRGGDWRNGSVRIAFGDGWITGYVSNTTPNYNYGYQYSTRGRMGLTVDLYDRYAGGPFMRLTQPVQVDSCRTIVLNPVHDANRNCAQDTGEKIPLHASIGLRSKLRPLGVNAISAGARLKYSHYPGDSTWIDTLALYFGSTFSQQVGLRTACPGLVITDSSPDSLVLPFEAGIKLDQVFPMFNQTCYADTLRFSLGAWLAGFPGGQQYRFIADYGDGSRDSTSFSYSSDTLTLWPAHRYNIPGVMNCTFILQSDAGAADTVYYQLTVDNCFPAFVGAFYDLNKNCVLDPGEAQAADCAFATAGGLYTGIDPATGFAQLSIWSHPDTVIRVIDHISQPEQGYYFGTVNATQGCPWPHIDTPRTRLLLPLIEAPVFSVQRVLARGNPCAMDYRYLLSVDLHGNYGRRYKLVHYAGDGLNTDTFQLSTKGNNTLPIPWRSFPAGSYQPAYRIFDETTGRIIARGLLPVLDFEDSCSGSGRLFIDSDGDCTFSSGDRPLAMQSVDLYVNGALQTVLTDTGGRFSTGHSAVADSLRVPDSVRGSYVLACGVGPNPAVIKGAAMEFPYACASAADLRILVSHRYFKPGADDTLYLYPAGHSCEAGPGMLSLSLPAGLGYTSSDLTGASISGGVVSWAIDTLRNLPDVIRVALHCAPAAGAGVLCLDASLNGPGADPQPADNDFRLCDSVRSAIPDYYKSVSSDSMAADGALLSDREIVYSLRIRNSSLTDTLHSMLLFDTLDTRLDLNSLRMLDANFPYAAQLMPGGVLRTTSIGAPGLAPAQELAVRFSVMPQPGLSPGTAIRNRFSVVADGVPEGESNTLLNPSARVPSGVVPAALTNELRVYPVPAAPGGSFFIELPAGLGVGSYEVLDARGAVCAKGPMVTRQTRVSALQLPPGLYLVRVVTERGVCLRKMVIAGEL